MRSKPLPRPILTFRVYPERRHRPRSRLYLTVNVFNTVAEMQDYLRRGPNPRRPGRFCKGIASTFERWRPAGRKMHLMPEIGEIVLAKNWVRVGVVAHEACHAAFGLALRRKFVPIRTKDGVDAAEERFCYAAGDIARAICWHTRKLLLHG